MHPERGPQGLDALELHGSLAAHARAGSEFLRDCTVICPQLDTTRWWSEKDAGWIDKIVESLGLGGARLVLTGFSYGGEGAFQIASSSVLGWSTIWAIDPALQKGLPPLPRANVRVLVQYGREQPGAENIEAFSKALGLEKWLKGSLNLAARRVGQDLSPLGHQATCRAAYEQYDVYGWVSS